MEAPVPDINNKINIINDLKEQYSKILTKYLVDRVYNENSVKTWTNDILLEAKEYFIQKYSDYNLYLYCLISEAKTPFSQDYSCIFNGSNDIMSWVDFKNDSITCVLSIMIFKINNLDDSINDFESNIIKKGNEIIIKYMENRKFSPTHNITLINNITKEHNDFIIEKVGNKMVRTFSICRIFQNPLDGKYDFNYTCYGKDIYRVIFLNYQNDFLICDYELFFFK